MLKDRYTFEEMVDIIAKLRGENGCPWDREQTHESLKEFLLEETYETLDAVDSKKGEKLSEELGDVLLQILLHAQIGKEEGAFDIEDIISGLAKKMIIRHPHVFSDVAVRDANDVLTNWDQIKKKEKKFESASEMLKDIPKNFPALLRAQKVNARFVKSGNVSLDFDETLEIVSGKIEKIKDAAKNNSPGELAKELGAALFMMTKLAGYAKINPEMALMETTNKAIETFLEYEKSNASSGGFDSFVRDL